MLEIVGIRFKRAGKIYDFNAAGLPLQKNDLVVVESDFGLTLGRVIRDKIFLDKEPRPLKQVLRIATEDDLEAVRENKKLEKEAFEYCLERIKARGIHMKLICTESTIDKKRIIFFFTADGRIDFRELVKDLAARFRTRIEMRQVGVRDESKMIGGVGICGRELCCCTFLSSFEPVAIKMAKDQELVLNVAKLSGLCGRLMCCLRYEFDGDPKDIAIDDEPIPQDEPVSSRSSDTTMASILSTITEEDKETDTVDAYSEDKHPNKIETIAFKGNKTAIEHRSQETSSGPQQRHDNNRDDNKKPDRKGFKRRKYFKK